MGPDATAMRHLVNFDLPLPCMHSRVDGFEPAFLDTATLAIYRSRLADGRPAPFHSAEGLPDAVVWSRAPDGRVVMAKPTLVRGYVRRGYFYTRAAAERAAREWGLPQPAVRA